MVWGKGEENAEEAEGAEVSRRRAEANGMEVMYAGRDGLWWVVRTPPFAIKLQRMGHPAVARKKFGVDTIFVRVGR